MTSDDPGAHASHRGNIVPVDRVARLSKLSFGGDVAEYEDHLDAYFLRTPAFWAVVQDDADLVLGAKGSGKSALARYLTTPEADIEALNDVVVMPAFNLRGSVLFKRLAEEEWETDESTFRELFLALMVGVAGNYLVRTFPEVTDINLLRASLRECGLLVEDPTITGLWRRVMRRLRPKLTAKLDIGATGSQTITGAAEFGDAEPEASTLHASRESLEAALEMLYSALERLDLRCWVIFDRLDEAFPENRDLERTALRGLMRAHLDACSYGSRFRSKLFLRLDLFERITEEAGFVNATHLRPLRISWDSDAILHMVARRLLESEDDPSRREQIEGDIDTVHGRRRICRSILPDNVNNVQSLVWLMLVTVDASREFNPRNVLSLLRFARAEALNIAVREQETQGPLIPARALAAAFRQLSVSRLQDTLFSESASARKYIERLRGRVTKFTRNELARQLRVRGDELEAIINELRYVGFLRLDEDNLVVPPLFRPALFVAVHGAELKIDADTLGSELFVDPGERHHPVDEQAAPEPPIVERKRRTRRRRPRSSASDRDELVPSGMRSEVEHELDFAEVLADALPAEGERQVALTDGNEERTTSLAAAELLANVHTDSATQAATDTPNPVASSIVAARDLGQQGQALAGFHLLWPSLTHEISAVCAAADLAVASGDLFALSTARQLLAVAPMSEGAVAGRYLVLTLMHDEPEDLAQVIRQIDGAPVKQTSIAIVRMVSMAPSEEARFWRRSIRLIGATEVADSNIPHLWTILAASRVLPVCRLYWEQGLDSASLDEEIVRAQIWEDANWGSALEDIAGYISNYASGTVAPGCPVLVPYQILSLLTLLNRNDRLPSELRTTALARLSRELAHTEAIHQDRFVEWARYSSIVLEVEFPRNVRARRAQAVLQRSAAGAVPLDNILASLIRILEAECRPPGDGMLLAQLGLHLRREVPTFSVAQYGHPTLLSLVTTLATRNDLIEVGRRATGHPFVRLVPSVSPE